MAGDGRPVCLVDLPLSLLIGERWLAFPRGVIWFKVCTVVLTMPALLFVGAALL